MARESKRIALQDLPHSPLADYPDHARLIGMISIEIANLETTLGEMLGSLLHISIENGRLVYLTPKSAFGRLAILENLHSDGNNMFKRGSQADRTMGNILRRARTVIDKRHKIIHNSWGLAEQEDESRVATRSLPFRKKDGMTFVEDTELETLVQDIRILNRDPMDFRDSNFASWPPYTSQPKPPLQSEDDQNRTPDNPRKEKAPKRKVQRSA